jgi:hypothetical protein
MARLSPLTELGRRSLYKRGVQSSTLPMSLLPPLVDIVIEYICSDATFKLVQAVDVAIPYRLVSSSSFLKQPPWQWKAGRIVCPIILPYLNQPCVDIQFIVLQNRYMYRINYLV